jgi:hypothetical protein
MTEPEQPGNKITHDLNSRLSNIEKAFHLHERIVALETGLFNKDITQGSRLPWWKDSKTITIIAALLAAVVPLGCVDITT